MAPAACWPNSVADDLRAILAEGVAVRELAACVCAGVGVADLGIAMIGAAPDMLGWLAELEKKNKAM